MSTLLQVTGLTHNAGEKLLFDDLGLTLNSGERVGLVGHNGVGKSTLLHILAGRIRADAGEVHTQRQLNFSLVEQFLPKELEAEDLRSAVAERVSAENAWQAEALLMKLGFSESEQIQRVGVLSGGQKNRLMFARAVIAEPGLLLLDEPTNYLDLSTLLVFQRYLQEFRGAFVLISHDRTFLDAVTTSTLILRDRKTYAFRASYSKAIRLLEEMDASARLRNLSEQKKIDSARRSAKRLAEWGRTYDNEKLARRAKNMHKRVERMEENRTFVTDGSPLDLELDLSEVRSRQILSVGNLQVSVPEHSQKALFRVENLLIRPGDRIALLGANGVGKTTFIRELVESFRSPDESSPFVFSPQVTLGYFDQELDQVVGSESLLKFVAERVDWNDQAVRSYLIKAGFAYSEHERSVSSLSGGERARVQFLVLSINKPNFLILDEPTNHIDIDGNLQLEKQLLESNATLLITSHDRRFLETLGVRFLWIHQNRLQEINDIEYYYRYLMVDGIARSKSDADCTIVRPELTAGTSTGEPNQSVETDSILQEIVTIEASLETDLARKAKFQKPLLQQSWNERLIQLYEKLEQSERKRDNSEADG